MGKLLVLTSKRVAPQRLLAEAVRCCQPANQRATHVTRRERWISAANGRRVQTCSNQTSHYAPVSVSSLPNPGSSVQAVCTRLGPFFSVPPLRPASPAAHYIFIPLFVNRYTQICKRHDLVNPRHALMGLDTPAPSPIHCGAECERKHLLPSAPAAALPLVRWRYPVAGEATSNFLHRLS